MSSAKLSIHIDVIFSIISADHLPSISSRIVGGYNAEDGEAPYFCSMQFHKTHFCGCAIISTEWVITAAHCLDNFPS